MNNLTVSVIIPNFNGQGLLAKNLPSVIKAKANKKNQILEIIVVDDYSSDNSVNFLKSNFPEVKIIKHKANRGFSSSVNTGARAAQGKLLALLNTDVVPEVDFLIPVFAHFDNPNTFSVSLHEKGYGAGRGYFSEGYIQLGMKSEGKIAQQSFYVSGGSGIFRREYWVKLNGMDEKLLSPFYWEDVDLCYRAWKRGFVNLWEPESRVRHDHESTISKAPKKYVNDIKERNRLLMLWKNIHSITLMRKHAIGLLSRCVKNPGYLRIVFMAFTKIVTLIKSRRRERRESVLSDEAVFAKFNE